MKFLILLFTTIFFTYTPAFAGNSHAPNSTEKNGILIQNAHIMGRKSTATGAFMDITNTTNMDDVLLGIKPDPAFAGRLEIHVTEKQNGTAVMKQVLSIPIPKNKTVHLKQGGYHVMVMGLRKPVQKGKKYPITLQFQNAGDIMVILPVKPISMVRKKGDSHSHK